MYTSLCNPTYGQAYPTDVFISVFTVIEICYTHVLFYKCSFTVKFWPDLVFFIIYSQSRALLKSFIFLM